MRLPFLIALSLSAATATAAEPFDRTAWQQDFAQLKSELVNRYVNLAWKASDIGGVDLPALDRKTTAALSSATDNAQAADAIRAFISGFRDGHLSELPTLAATTTPAVEPDKPQLETLDPAAGCAALGYGSTGPVAFSLPFESLPGFHLLSDGISSTYRVGAVTRAGVTIGMIRIHNFKAEAFQAACLHAWNDLRGRGTPITRRALGEAAGLGWFRELVQAVAVLRKAGATTLVIDIGRNSGGDDSGDLMPRLFTDRQVRSARLLMVDAPVAANYFSEKIDDIDEALTAARSDEAKAALKQARAFFSAQKAAIGQGRCDLSWVWRERRSWSPENCNRLLPAGYAGGYSPGLPRGAYGDAKAATVLSLPSIVQAQFGSWTGPTYVLADKRSYSSAEMFAAVMQDNGIAKIVGDRTGGDGCGFMTDGEPIVLRHSRLRFRVPNCMRLRADGTNEEAGISPDLPVLPTEGESDRARGERVLRSIAGDAGVAVHKPSQS